MCLCACLRARDNTGCPALMSDDAGQHLLFCWSRMHVARHVPGNTCMLRNADRSLRKSGMPCPSLCVCMLTKRTKSGQKWHSSRSLNGCKTFWGTRTSATSPSARKDSRTWPWISTTTSEGGGAFVCSLGGECSVHEISCPFFSRPVSPPPSRCSVCNMRPRSAICVSTSSWGHVLSARWLIIA